MKIKIFYFIICVFFITSCIKTQNVSDYTNDKIYDFIDGLFHGFIILFSLIGNLFNSDITIYAINNNGLAYNFGYVMGAYIFFYNLFK